MGTWYIVGFYDGFANGPGYGNQIKRNNLNNGSDKPRCNSYGAHLMCQTKQPIDVTTTSYTTTTTSMTTTSYCEYMYDSGLCDDGDYGYYYYYSTTTTSAPYTSTTQHDDSCYKYHAGMDEFENAIHSGFEEALDNDIYTVIFINNMLYNLYINLK